MKEKIREALKELNLNLYLIILIIATLVLGSLGYKTMYEEHSIDGNWFDYIYNSITLFEFDLEEPKMGTELPWMLEVARWLAGGITMYALFVAIFHFVKLKWDILTKGDKHIIIVGAGEKGKTLGIDFLKKHNDKMILFVEKDKNSPNIELLEDEGAIILFGDATDKEIQRKAHFQKADKIILLTDKDTTNIEILSTFVNTADDKTDTKCYIHIFNNEYYEFLNAEKFSKLNIDIKVFNIYTNASRLLLKDKLLGSTLFVDEKSIKDKNNVLKIAILGFDKLAENLLIYILNIGYFYNETPINITIIYDKDNLNNKNKEDEFLAKYDVLNPKYNGNYWEVNFIDDGEFFKSPSLDYHHIFVAFEDEEKVFSTFMALSKKYHTQIIEQNIDIALYSNNLKNTATIITSDKSQFEHIRTFGEIDKVCNYEIVIDEKLDKQAILNNKYYNQLHGYDDKNKSAEEEWKSLNHFLKDSNRYSIEHNEIKKDIISKLTKNREPLQSYEEMKKMIIDEFGDENVWDKFRVKPIEYAEKLTKDELIQLGKIEHKRWNAFHILNGWKAIEINGDETEKIKKDTSKKLHPCLVSWEDLDKVSKNHNHNYKTDDIESVMRIESLSKEK